MINKKWYLIFIFSLFAANVLMAAPGTIKTGDVISVWVKGEPDLSVERTVERDGSIAYPLLGNVGVNNLETLTAAKLIAGMLEDGYLRKPLVQVSIKSSGSQDSQSPIAKARPLSSPASVAAASGRKSVTTEKPTLVEVFDKITNTGIGGAAMMLGNRIYQSNRLGQIMVDGCNGRIVLIADGYQIVDGNIESLLSAGNPPKIYLEKVKLADEITFQVLDAFSKKPLAGVKIVLDAMKVNTNKNGTFKIKKLQKEFGEVSFDKRGYKPYRMVVDFKGPDKQTILMVRND